MQAAELNRIIGINLRETRLAHGLSQEAVGKYLGVSFQQIQKYERGENAFRCETLLRLAKLFKCPPEELLAGIIPLAAHPKEQQDGLSRMLAQFSRIQSAENRKAVCRMVRTMADMLEKAQADHAA